jgi:chorismate synthase
MSHNSFGHLFRVMTWGESHGAAIGCVVDGCPPRIPLTEADIQPFLDRRRPGQSKFVTQRQEPDQVRILSGTFEGVTTGTPISLLIENQDQRSKDYGEIKDRFRPGHADLTYELKYGVRDYRGGGRSSARETAMRVAAGAIARKVLEGVTIRGALVAIGGDWVDNANWDWAEVDNNPFFCPDPVAAARWEEKLSAARKSGSSLGAVVEVVAEGVPPGLGAPVYGKLDADLAAALMSINAVKGVEIGDGFEVAGRRGSEAHDPISWDAEAGAYRRESALAGGIEGGISTGELLVARAAMKPLATLNRPTLKTVDTATKEETVSFKERTDVTAVPALGVVAETMVALVLADEATRKFGGDSLDELRRNRDAFVANLG